jgi:hypothetical protein
MTDKTNSDLICAEKQSASANADRIFVGRISQFA